METIERIGVADMSPSIGQLAAALAKAQSKINGAAKDSTNPHFNSRYADLASVWDACRDPLSANEIAVIQLPKAEGSKVQVTTMLAHSSGEYIRETLSCVARDAGAQAVGSAITYLRRYSLASFAGIAPADDDGESAEGRGESAQAGRQATTRKAAPRTKAAPAEARVDTSGVAEGWKPARYYGVQERVGKKEGAKPYKAHIFLTELQPKTEDQPAIRQEIHIFANKDSASQANVLEDISAGEITDDALLSAGVGCEAEVVRDGNFWKINSYRPRS